MTTVHVRSTTKDLVKSNNTRNYTVNALARSKDSVSAYIVAPGGKLSTGHSTSSTNPTSTTVQAHTEYSGLLTIAEHSTTDTATACGAGYTCFGQYVTAGYLYASERKPDIMTVTFDSSAVPHHRSITHVRLFDYRAHRPQVLRRVQRLGDAGPLRRIQNAAFQRQLAAGDPVHRQLEVRLGGGS